MRQTCQGSAALFRLVSAAQLRAAGCESFSAYGRLLEERFRLKFTGEPVRIREGALCLNEPARAGVCLAVFQVASTLEPLLAGMR
jgi:hypothetical protein